MKDGVKYQLYFGDPKSAEKGDSKKLNRYLMVTAELDDSMLPRPKLEAEEEPLGPDPTDKPEEETKPDEGKSQDKDDTSEKQDEEAVTGKKEKSDDKTGDDKTGDEKAGDQKADDDEKSEDEKKADEVAAKKKRDAIRKENKRKMMSTTTR